MHGIRYVNVGTVYDASGVASNLDLVVTNETAYTAHNASLNVLNGRFAQINLACNTDVRLRVTISRSCSVGSSCVLCDDMALGTAARESCYAAGCACFGRRATNVSECTGASKAAARMAYGCGGDE